jgi:hypothetical protein
MPHHLSIDVRVHVHVGANNQLPGSMPGHIEVPEASSGNIKQQSASRLIVCIVDLISCLPFLC